MMDAVRDLQRRVAGLEEDRAYVKRVVQDIREEGAFKEFSTIKALDASQSTTTVQQDADWVHGEIKGWRGTNEKLNSALTEVRETN